MMSCHLAILKVNKFECFTCHVHLLTTEQPLCEMHRGDTQRATPLAWLRNKIGPGYIDSKSISLKE